MAIPLTTQRPPALAGSTVEIPLSLHLGPDGDAQYEWGTWEWRGKLTYNITATISGPDHVCPNPYDATMFKARFDVATSSDGVSLIEPPPGWWQQRLVVPPRPIPFVAFGRGGSLPAWWDIGDAYRGTVSVRALDENPDDFKDCIARGVLRSQRSDYFAESWFDYAGAGKPIQVAGGQHHYGLITFAGKHESTVEVHHRPYFDWGWLCGIYLNGGSLDLDIGVARSGRDGECGEFIVEMPICLGFVRFGDSWVEEREMVTLTKQYVRRSAAPSMRAEPAGETMQLGIGESAPIAVTVTNESDLYNLTQADLYGDAGSCALITPKGPAKAAVEPIPPRGSRTVTFDIEGTVVGQSPAVFDCWWLLDRTECPQSVRTGWEHRVQVRGPQIVVVDPDATAGSLAGLVTDADSGSPLSAVDVVITPTGIFDKTSDQGFYSLPDLDPGRYVLSATLDGYARHEIGIDIEAGHNAVVDVALLPYGFVGNRRTRELHVRGCDWVALMARRNKQYFERREAALRQGYNGCHHCMPAFDSG